VRIQRAFSFIALIGFVFSGCIAEVSDKFLSEARSPSGKWTATVVDRDAGVMTGSIIVFLHPSAKPYQKGEALIALTNATPPTVEFVDDSRLRVRLFSGTRHNKQNEALGVSILYE
jgi:hypothetical protein